MDLAEARATISPISSRDGDDDRNRSWVPERAWGPEPEAQAAWASHQRRSQKPVRIRAVHALYYPLGCFPDPGLAR